MKLTRENVSGIDEWNYSSRGVVCLRESEREGDESRTRSRQSSLFNSSGPQESDHKPCNKSDEKKSPLGAGDTHPSGKTLWSGSEEC